MRCITDQGSVVNDVECHSRARPQGSEECNMGPCVTNWYFTGWSKAVSEAHVGQDSGPARASSALLALSARRSAAPACRNERWCA